jgi:hypothetical protein
MSSRNMVGAWLTVLINGRVIGEVTSFSFNSSTPHSDVVGLDQLTPFELAATSVKISGSMSVLRRQASGGLEGRGITAHVGSLSEQRYISILIVNRKDQTTFFRADNCMVQGQQWEASARGRVTGSFSFTALSWSNDADPPDF